MENLKEKLTDIQYKVTQENATEKPFENEFYNNEEDGIYVDIIDGNVLFSSKDKFDSGCGWPSFSKPLNKENIYEDFDDSHGLRRTEVRTEETDYHLGHVFTDGPTESGGLRYCINSASLHFIPRDELEGTKYEKYLSLFE